MTFLPFEIPPGVIDAIGVAGFALYVLSYSLLTTRKITSNSSTYFALNLVAASLVLIGLTSAFNLASALIQLFWIGASIAAIILRVRQRGEGRIVAGA